MVTQILTLYHFISAKGLFKILEKYRPETQAVRKERLKKAAEAKVWKQLDINIVCYAVLVMAQSISFLFE